MRPGRRPGAYTAACLVAVNVYNADTVSSRNKLYNLALAFYFDVLLCQTKLACASFPMYVKSLHILYYLTLTNCQLDYTHTCEVN